MGVNEHSRNHRGFKCWIPETRLYIVINQHATGFLVIGVVFSLDRLVLVFPRFEKVDGFLKESLWFSMLSLNLLDGNGVQNCHQKRFRTGNERISQLQILGLETQFNDN